MDVIGFWKGLSCICLSTILLACVNSQKESQNEFATRTEGFKADCIFQFEQEFGGLRKWVEDIRKATIGAGE